MVFEFNQQERIENMGLGRLCLRCIVPFYGTARVIRKDKEVGVIEAIKDEAREIITEDYPYTSAL